MTLPVSAAVTVMKARLSFDSPALAGAPIYAFQRSYARRKSAGVCDRNPLPHQIFGLRRLPTGNLPVALPNLIDL